MWPAVSSKPTKKIFTKIIKRPATIRTSSRIIIYSMSLMITVIKLEIKIRAIIKSILKPKEL